ncbi:cobalt ECF transporter T component CbiQ [Aeromicrobium wangtongii]|uniref:cobalt ECF transporter T component CbiQ n=1 Tax=Aeromicrobium wangtongii TaxID=2969247 RepID=UPI0020171AD0|nr:cobalt ECF transporter T component CbiQ [Aeromicrobium wangtongii]MCL3817667.1 cobalt ECF transporter T component CbiQ [Aeromicrobium wangtongii]
MGVGHARPNLLVPTESPIHRLRPECKLAATILFVVAVVSAPREAIWVFGVFAAIVIAGAWLAHLPLLVLARRLTVELPFIAFAVLLPFLSPGPDVEVLGVSLSADGLWAAWNIVVKGTLGIAATAVLAATTPVPSLLSGLERLHMPRLVIAVAGFMIRYADVLTAESRRMQVARLSRGYDPRWFWQVKAVATSTGTLFVRSFERGERVHLAMLARGYSGTMPCTDVQSAAVGRDWAVPMAVPIVATALTCLAWIVR